MERHAIRLVLAAVVGAVVLMGMPGPAAAADGRVDTATTTYELVPSKGVVQVAIDLRVENHQPSTTQYVACTKYSWDPSRGWLPTPSTCPQTTDYYLNDSAFWVEDAAQSLHASADSGSVSLSLVKKDAGFRLMKATFKNTFNGQARRIHVTYTLPGGKPRSADPMRAGAAYAALCATGNGIDSGRVRVIVPSGFTFDTWGGTATSSMSGSNVVYDSGTLSDPADYYLCLSGTNEAALKQTTVTAGDGRSFRIEAWPEDTAWQRAIQTQLASSVAGLESLIGSSLPGSGPVHVREVAALDLGDYAGTYDPATQVAEVAEDAIDTVTLPHELAHVWFNDSFLADTWLDEGYAEWAARTVDPGEMASCSDPGAFPGTGSPSLGHWTYLSAKPTSQEEKVIAFNYDAACYIVTDAAATVGTAGMRQALQYLASGRIPYLEDSAKRRSAAVADWRTWLDAVDEESGARPSDPDHLQSLLAQYGIATDPAQLSARSDARSRYHQLKSATAGWRLPTFIGQAMADWRFSDATAAMTVAAATRTTASEVAKALPSVDGVNGPVKALVEKAGSLTDLNAADVAADAQLAAAREVAAAIAGADRATGPLDVVGLLGTDLKGQEAAAVAAVAAGRADSARSAAAQLQEEVTGASTSGALRLGSVVGLLGVLLLAAVLIRRRRRSTPSLALTVAAPTGSEADGPAETTPTGDEEAISPAGPGEIETAALASQESVPDDPSD